MQIEHDPLFIAWLAGFIDGEGCFHIHRMVTRGNVSYSPVLVIANTHRASIDLIAQSFQCGSVSRMMDSTAKAHYRQPYQYQVHGAQAIAIARLVMPHLRIKQAQAAFFLIFPSARRGARVPDDINQERIRIYQAVRELNGRVKRPPAA